MKRHTCCLLFVLVHLASVPCVAQVIIQGKVKINGNVTLRIPPFGLLSLSPNAGPVGTTVTITGTSFGGSQGTSTVDFGGSAPTVTSWGNSGIGVTVPSGLSVGNVMVQVTVAGVNSNPLAFEVTPGPPSGDQISLSPTSGTVSTPVTITGINFGATQGASTVTFYNEVAATPTSWSVSSIVVPVPSNAITGAVTVTVNSVPHTANFTVAPVVTGLSPASGAVGTSVTITGANFGATQGSSTVTFNGVAAAPTSWNASTITAPVPSGAATGPVVVTVYVDPTHSYASNAATFTVPTSGLPGCGS